MNIPPFFFGFFFFFCPNFRDWQFAKYNNEKLHPSIFRFVMPAFKLTLQIYSSVPTSFLLLLLFFLWWKAKSFFSINHDINDLKHEKKKNIIDNLTLVYTHLMCYCENPVRPIFFFINKKGLVTKTFQLFRKETVVALHVSDFLGFLKNTSFFFFLIIIERSQLRWKM